jgi:hypothetical protein
MKSISLTKGKYTLVDDKDYEYLSQYKWYVAESRGIFYAVRKPRLCKAILMHRVITDAPNGMDVDHVNGDGLDNQRKNLRVCTHSQNLTNVGRRINNKSGHTGVSWNKRDKRWYVQIRINKDERIHLGCFIEIQDAISVYKKAVNKYHGNFSRTTIGEKNK